MKVRGIFLTICLILVLGVGVTIYTSQITHQKEIIVDTNSAGGSNFYASRPVPDTTVQEHTGETIVQSAPEARQRMAVTEETQVMKAELAMGAAVPETAMAQAAMEENLDSPVAPLSEDNAVSLEEVRPAEVISPLTGSMERITMDGTVSSSGKNYYARLEEIDLQIQKMRSEETDSTTVSIKAAAEYEYRLWDTELNEVYQTILLKISDDEKDQLKKEEKDWLKTRDQLAKEAASKCSGGTIESVEYVASMAASTRTRVYELVEQYDETLSE